MLAISFIGGRVFSRARARRIPTTNPVRSGTSGADQRKYNATTAAAVTTVNMATRFEVSEVLEEVVLEVKDTEGIPAICYYSINCVCFLYCAAGDDGSPPGGEERGEEKSKLEEGDGRSSHQLTAPSEGNLALFEVDTPSTPYDHVTLPPTRIFTLTVTHLTLPLSLSPSHCHCHSCHPPTVISPSHCHCHLPTVTVTFPLSLSPSNCHCHLPTVTVTFPLSMSLISPSHCHCLSCHSPTITFPLSLSLSSHLPTITVSHVTFPLSLSPSHCHCLSCHPPTVTHMLQEDIQRRPRIASMLATLVQYDPVAPNPVPAGKRGKKKKVLCDKCALYSLNQCFCLLLFPFPLPLSLPTSSSLLHLLSSSFVIPLLLLLPSFLSLPLSCSRPRWGPSWVCTCQLYRIFSESYCFCDCHGLSV